MMLVSRAPLNDLFSDNLLKSLLISMHVNMLNPIWRYRHFIFGSVKREFYSRYQNSLLGILWALLSPISMIFVYTVIFSRLMGARLPGNTGLFSYSIYLCAGIISWGLFSELSLKSLNMFLENANLLKKINFPRYAFQLFCH